MCHQLQEIPVTDWKVLLMVFLKWKSPKLLGKDTCSDIFIYFCLLILHFSFILLSTADYSHGYLFQVPN